MLMLWGSQKLSQNIFRDREGGGVLSLRRSISKILGCEDLEGSTSCNLTKSEVVAFWQLAWVNSSTLCLEASPDLQLHPIPDQVLTLLGPSTSHWTPYMYMVTISLIPASCYGNSGARDGRKPAEMEHWLIPKGVFWPGNDGESPQLNSVEYIEHLPCFSERGVTLELSSEHEWMQPTWLIVCIQHARNIWKETGKVKSSLFVLTVVICGVRNTDHCCLWLYWTGTLRGQMLLQKHF